MTVQIDTENLLFSVVTHGEEASATEALLSFGVFQAWEGVSPLFPGNAVGKPIPVMTEGKYYVKAKVDGKEKYREVKFSAEDIQRLANKQPRDVPFNYDHRRAPGKEGVKGWLRFGKAGDQDLHFVGHVTTPDGQRLTALFATPELSEEAQQMVTSGTYRDVSVEYRGLDDVLTGCALTSYPVMRNLQFSDLENTEDTTQTQPEVIEAAEVAPPATEEEMDLSKLTKEQRKELLDGLLGDHGLNLETLSTLSTQFSDLQEKSAKSAYEMAMVKAEAEINALLGNAHFGMTDEIATGAQEVLAWAATEDTLKFGEDGGSTPDVPGVLRGLLTVIGKQGHQIALLGGEAEIVAEDGEKKFGEITEDTELADLDKTRVSALAGLAKAYL